MDVILATFNARYQHASLGLRYLHANLGDLKDRTELVELTLEHRPTDVAEAILAKNPRVVGFGVYLWNVLLTTETVQILKTVAPDVKIVVGGPEVSYEQNGQPLCEMADAVIAGEGEESFRVLVARYLAIGAWPTSKIVPGLTPNLETMNMPYRLYTDEDVKHRVIYVEVSRGCAYRCEFCLSALDEKVRLFPLEEFLAELEILLKRGARQFKFVDRTFNLNTKVSTRILDFFLQHVHLGLFLHFEMVPERLPDELKKRIEQFPDGSLQFEVGIQTWNETVSKGISRPQNYAKITENLQYLKANTKVHLHTDLIVGLPGEDKVSFGRGFNKLLSMKPHEIQVGILKRLKGMPLNRQNESAGLLYESAPPFSVLKTKCLTFGEVQGFKRFAKFWDLIANQGKFPSFIKHMEENVSRAGEPFFDCFWELAEFLGKRHPKLHSIGLPSLVESLQFFFDGKDPVTAASIRSALASDAAFRIRTKANALASTPKRQERHRQAQAARPPLATPGPDVTPRRLANP